MNLLDKDKLLKWLKNNIFIIEKPNYNTDKIPSNIIFNKYNEQINIREINEMIKDRFGNEPCMNIVIPYLLNECHERENKKRDS